MRIWRLMLLVLALCLFGLPLLAQQVQPRDYAITDVQVDTAARTLTVTVRNNGGATSTSTFLLITDTACPVPQSQPRLQQIITPLATGAEQVFTFPLAADAFPAGSTSTLCIAAGIDVFEGVNDAIGADNLREIVVDFGTTSLGPTQAAPVDATPDAPASPSINLPIRIENDTIYLDVGDGLEVPVQTALLVGGGLVGGLVLLLVLFFIVRALLRPKDFPLWQPPYGSTPLLDPNSVEGRRQAWQQYAINPLILAANTEGTLHPIKQVTGADGLSLGNWTITALRMTLYDNYGRVTRTQCIAPTRLVKSLNQVLRRRLKTDDANLHKLLNPIARAFVRRFKKNLNSKNAFLPIALDVRMSGKHGEVRIFFELYQHHNQAWYRIDRWEPTMAIATRGILENYTFTIHGIGAGETYKQYLARLQDDLSWLLTEMVRARKPQQAESRQVYAVPDTLSGMKPVGL